MDCTVERRRVLESDLASSVARWQSSWASVSSSVTWKRECLPNPVPRGNETDDCYKVPSLK